MQLGLKKFYKGSVCETHTHIEIVFQTLYRVCGGKCSWVCVCACAVVYMRVCTVCVCVRVQSYKGKEGEAAVCMYVYVGNVQYASL